MDRDECIRKFQKELNGGTVSLILLSVMNNAAEPMYGYQIAKLIEQLSGELAIMKQGALYPVLRSLEQRGLLSSSVTPSVSGPPRKYYQITETGRQCLAQWLQIWQQTQDLINKTVEGEYHV